jgi:hypothetical protein
MIVQLSTDVPLPPAQRRGLQGGTDQWCKTTGRLASAAVQKTGLFFIRAFQDYGRSTDNLTPMLSGLSKMSIEAFNAFMVTFKKSGGMELGPATFAMQDTFRLPGRGGR